MMWSIDDLAIERRQHDVGLVPDGCLLHRDAERNSFN